MRYSFTLTRRVPVKRTENSKCRPGCGSAGILVAADGNAERRGCCGERDSVSTELPSDSARPRPGLYTEELKAGTRRNVCTQMFTKAEVRKQLKFPLTGERATHMRSSHTMEH